MLQLPVTTLTASAGAAAPASPAGGAAGAAMSPLENLLVRTENEQQAATQQLAAHFDRIGSGQLSTIDMLRLQKDLNTFTVRMELTAHLADKVGSAIQTMTQRS